MGRNEEGAAGAAPYFITKEGGENRKFITGNLIILFGVVSSSHHQTTLVTITIPVHFVNKISKFVDKTLAEDENGRTAPSFAGYKRQPAQTNPLPFVHI